MCKSRTALPRALLVLPILLTVSWGMRTVDTDSLSQAEGKNKTKVHKFHKKDNKGTDTVCCCKDEGASCTSETAEVGDRCCKPFPGETIEDACQWRSMHMDGGYNMAVALLPYDAKRPRDVHTCKRMSSKEATASAVQTRREALLKKSSEILVCKVRLDVAGYRSDPSAHGGHNEVRLTKLLLPEDVRTKSDAEICATAGQAQWNKFKSNRDSIKINLMRHNTHFDNLVSYWMKNFKSMPARDVTEWWQENTASYGRPQWFLGRRDSRISGAEAKALCGTGFGDDEQAVYERLVQCVATKGIQFAKNPDTLVICTPKLL